MYDMKYNKERTQSKPIENLALPEAVSIPLSQHVGKICQPCVKLKDKVSCGQVIGILDGGVFVPVHASISGEVTAIKNSPHPVMGTCLSIQIKSDGKDEKIAGLNVLRGLGEAEKLTPQELRKIIFDSGITGMGGAAFPAHIKLNPPKPIENFILNGAECEPYLTSDYRLMLENTGPIIAGMKLMARIVAAKNVFVAIEDNKPLAIKRFREQALKENFKVAVLKTNYPQGGEKQLTQTILRKEIPSGKLPFDIGVLVQNVSTAFAVYEAVYLSKPVYERVVTVTGSPLTNPKNLRVRIGTPIKKLIEACAPKIEAIRKVVIGGPMMGIAQETLDVPAIKSTGGILVFSKEEVHSREVRVCCRCGRCIDVCPARIMPAIIGMAAEKERWDIAANYDLLDCIECGLCSYICPAKRDLVHLIKYAKARVRK